MRSFFKNVSCNLSVVNCSEGFTLVELLVVIVIISILATLLLVNFVGVRQRGRDAQRKSDIRQIQTALELYRADIGNYPASLNQSTPCTNVQLTGQNSTVYMNKVPCDPTSTTPYYYNSPNPYSTYSLVACLENSADTDSNTTSTQPAGAPSCPSGKYYSVTQP